MKKNLFKKVIKGLVILSFVGSLGSGFIGCDTHIFRKPKEDQGILSVYKTKELKEIKLEQKDSHELKKYKAIYNVNLGLYNLRPKEDEALLIYDKACVKHKDMSFTEALMKSVTQVDVLDLDELSKDGKNIDKLESERLTLLKDPNIKEFSKEYVLASDSTKLDALLKKTTKNISSKEYLELGVRKLMHNVWDEQAKALIEMRDKINKMK